MTWAEALARFDTYVVGILGFVALGLGSAYLHVQAGMPDRIGPDMVAGTAGLGGVVLWRSGMAEESAWGLLFLLLAVACIIVAATYWLGVGWGM